MKKLLSSICLVMLVSASVAIAETTERVHSETDYKRDASGIERTTKTERSADPEGLGNKSWSKETARASIKHNGNSSETIKRESVDSRGTGHSMNEVIERKVDSDGTVSRNAERKEITDPKGFMNKTESKVKRTVVVKPDGETTVNEKIEGRPLANNAN